MPNEFFVTYIGPQARLVGETALARRDERDQSWLLQFDNIATGLGFGWYRFSDDEIEVNPSPFAIDPQ